MPQKYPGLTRHPKTGVFWIRRRLPTSVIGILSRKEHVETLGTKDARLAEAAFLDRMGELTRTWSALTAGPKALSPLVVRGLAGEFYRRLVKEHEDDPGTPGRWEAEIAKVEAVFHFKRRGPRNPYGNLQPEMHRFLLAKGVDYAHVNVLPLLRSFSEARLLAYRRLARMAEGDYSPDPAAARFPVLVQPENSARPLVAARDARYVLTVEGDWAKYVFDTGIALGSQKRFRPLLVKLGAHLRRENLALACTDDIERWVEPLRLEGLAAQTINDGYLAAARSFYSWGIRAKKVGQNPCSGVRYTPPKKTVLEKPRPQGFTDDEIALILGETLREPDLRLPKTMAAARRWVPWLCAYTGARVNEMTQLRGQDLRRYEVSQEQVWIITITPDAGNVKGRKPRDVALHPHLVEQGFLDFVKSIGSDALFYDPVRPRSGSIFNPPYQKVGERLAAWVRDIGVTDPRVAPNHGWRHHFNSVSRTVPMNVEVRDAMTGHAPRTVGEGYGDMPVSSMWTGIKLIPRFEAVAPVGARMTSKRGVVRSQARMAAAQRAKRTAE